MLGLIPVYHKILHPFGGRAEFGLRIDVKGEVSPDIMGDAHNLPFGDNVFDCVILDPPYSSDDAARLYGTEQPKFKMYTQEAVRVLREGGWLAMYHEVATPAIKGTVLKKRIFLENRMWHKLRCVHIHKKDTLAWQGIKGQAMLDLAVK